MSFDNVANSPQNPFKGQLFNKPTPAGTPGVNIYAGCKIDYKGNDATAANLHNILQGERTSTGGKVLKSNWNSKIFFFFSDHGASGFVSMPVGEPLYADRLRRTLRIMQIKKMYLLYKQH